MDIIWPDYEIIVSQAEEIIPPKLENTKAPAYLAELKANDLLSKMPEDFLLITADTVCLLYTSPSPRDQRGSRMPSSA